MLHFFRKIRRDLLTNNQFIKYLKYAIGEIILVVLGILIALYINNQNEVRKEREQFDEVLVEVEKELLSNISSVKNAIGFYTFKSQILLSIQFDTIKIEEYVDQKSVFYLHILTVLDHALFQDESLHKLSQINNLTKEQESIMDDLIYLNVHGKAYFNESTIALKNLQRINGDKFQSFDWYRSWLFSDFYDEKMINYFFKDPDFINRASTQYIAEREHLNWLLTYDRTAIESYIKIYKYLDSLGMKGSDSIRFEFDPNDYKHYLGKYKAKWCSDKDFVFDDSVTVTLEEGKLIWNGYRSDGPNTRKEIIPINRHNFRDNELGVYHLEFDDKGDVEGIWFSSPPPLWIYSLEKIR